MNTGLFLSAYIIKAKEGKCRVRKQIQIINTKKHQKANTKKQKSAIYIKPFKR